MTSKLAKILASTVSLSLIASPALAEKAGQLTSINGLDAYGAEHALKSRGFTNISSHKNTQGYTYSYWWDNDDKNCVVVEVYRDTVETINDASDKDCNHSGGGSAAAAVGAVAGLAILGALLGSKSHHTADQKRDEQQQGEFDRGYRDGLYNASYHNYNRSDDYSKGYEVGVDEREANLKDHHRRGGYSEAAQFTDLNGARAAGGMEELERRGFTQVDNFTSGTARYSIQWREASRQCLQVTIADGHFYDVRDIGSHPQCS